MVELEEVDPTDTAVCLVIEPTGLPVAAVMRDGSVLDVEPSPIGAVLVLGEGGDVTCVATKDGKLWGLEACQKDALEHEAASETGE